MEIFNVFDIGGTSIKYALMLKDATIIEKGAIQTDKSSFSHFIQSIIAVIKGYAKKYPLSGIAISSPGSVDSDNYISYGYSAIECIHGSSFLEPILSGTGLPVEMANDANCAALGEVWRGAGQGYHDIACLVCGSGIGGAIIKDAQIHRGAHAHGGEFGYMITDLIETKDGYKTEAWSGWSIVEIVKRVEKELDLLPGGLNGEKLFSMAYAGDEVAQKAIEQFFMKLAVGIFNIQYCYDPEIILIGGAISRRDDFLPRVRQAIDHIMHMNPHAAIKPQVKSCLFKDDANMIGALYNYLVREKQCT